MKNSEATVRLQKLMETWPFIGEMMRLALSC